MRCKKILSFIFVVLLLGLASATYTLSETGSYIATQYQTTDYLKANLNISFVNQPVGSVFTDSLGNSISLANLLTLNPDYYKTYNDLTNTTISSPYQTLKLDPAYFNISSATGNLSYAVNIDGSLLFSRTLQIISGNTIFDKTIQDKYSQLNVSKTEISKFDVDTQNILNDFLNISSIESNLSDFQAQSTGEMTSGELTNILNNVSAIKIPSSISQIETTNPISFYPSRENVNLDVLATIAGGSYGNNKEGYVDAVYAWNNQNLNTDVSFKEIVISYASGEQTILRIFQFTFDKGEGGLSNTAYFILQNLQDLKFEGIAANQISSSSGYSYINLNSIADKVVFYTPQDVDFINVPAFVSPSLNDLTPVKVEPYTKWFDNAKSKWILFAVIIIVVLLIGIVTYILLQRWYRRKYEVHLFKNRSNLFNIMTYIQNSKKKNMPREEIIKNLKKSGWSGEQISYAMRKYEGKKILGLIKMPLNITPETEKKPLSNQPQGKPVYRKFNMGSPATTGAATARPTQGKPPVTGRPPEKNPNERNPNSNPQNNTNKNTKV